MSNANNLTQENSQFIQGKIITLRGLQVMVDRDLSEIYGVENKRLNEQVKRNIERFPDKFRFQFTQQEKIELVANCDRFQSLKHSTTLPYAFTEQGVSMLSAVLRSPTAIKVSIQIIEAFVGMRKFMTYNGAIFQRLDDIEHKQLITETKLDKVFATLEAGETMPQQGIFYDGQIFDAYLFTAKLIKSATQSIVLIDSYIDETVLNLLSKRNKKVLATIYTKKLSPAFKLDLIKYNSQYETITVKKFTKTHDRFLIIDGKTIYHFGASLKDLGKQWFAFSQITLDVQDILNKLELGVTDE